MANEIIFREGFDYYNGTGANTGLQATWQVTGSSVALVPGRFGGQALHRVVTSTGYTECQAAMDAAVSEFALGISMKSLNMSYTAPAYSLVRLKDTFATDGYQVGASIYPDGSIRLVRQASYTSVVELGRSAAGLVTQDAWFYLELEGVIHDTAGELRAYLNGDPTPVINLSGIDTRAAGATVNTIGLGNSQNVGTHLDEIYYDDIYVKQGATRLGPRRITTLPLSGDFAVQWTPSSGLENYPNLNSVPISTADFVSSQDLNDVDTYLVANMTLNPTTIDEVCVVVCAAKDGVDPRAIKYGLDSSGSVSESDDYFLPGADYAIKRHPVPLNPNGSVAWDATTINSVRARIKVSV